MTSPQTFPSQPTSPSGSGVGTERPAPAAEWSEEGNREFSARFLDALSRLAEAAVEGEILRAKYECSGCSHPTHTPSTCDTKPIRFGLLREDKCACSVDSCK